MDSQAFTQAQLASAARISQPAVSEYLKGRIPSGDVLVEIAKALGTTAEALLSGETSSEPPGIGVWKHRAMTAEQKLEALKSGVVALVKKY